VYGFDPVNAVNARTARAVLRRYCPSRVVVRHQHMGRKALRRPARAVRRV